MRNRIPLLFITCCASLLAFPATAQSQTPEPTLAMPASLPASPKIRARRDVSDVDLADVGVILVLGTACVDEDGDGTCRPDEPSVRDTPVYGADGRLLALTDALGQFALRAVAGSGLSIVPPAGYRALTSTRPAGPRVDFPLIVDRVPASVAAPSALSPNLAPLPRISDSLLGILAGTLVVLLTLTNLRVTRSIESLRRTQVALAEQTSRGNIATWRNNLEQNVQREWRMVASQHIANLLGDTVRFNDRMGITGISTEPAPRFAVTDAVGRKFIFTTSVESLREFGLIGWRDRVLRVTESGSLSFAQALWDYILSDGQVNTVVPRSSPWYMAVRNPVRATFNPLAALRRGWALWTIRRAVRHSGPWQPAIADAAGLPAAPTSALRLGDLDFPPSRGGREAAQTTHLKAQWAEISPMALTEEIAPIRVDASSELAD